MDRNKSSGKKVSVQYLGILLYYHVIVLKIVFERGYKLTLHFFGALMKQQQCRTYDFGLIYDRTNL